MTSIILRLATAAAGCIVLSFLFAWTKTPHQDTQDTMHLRRALKLIPLREVIRYRDPMTVRARSPDASSVAPTWWKDIDYHQIGLCGGQKCFFLSLSDPTNGYLIWDGYFKQRSQLPEAIQAYIYASELELKYSIRQLSTGPPYEMKVRKYFRQHLWSNYKPFFASAKSLIIQPSRTAPQGSIIMRCYDSRVKYGRLGYILQNMNQESIQRLLGELEYTIPIVEAHPELKTDFQLMIDPEGQLYHLDLDRTHNGPPSEKSMRNYENCLEDAIEFIRESMNESKIVQ